MRIPISVHADFYQSPPSRFVEVIGTKGQLKADLIRATFTRTIMDNTEELAYPNFERNAMFLDEFNDFLECIRTNQKETISLEDGLASLAMANGIKKSLLSGGIENVIV